MSITIHFLVAVIAAFLTFTQVSFATTIHTVFWLATSGWLATDFSGGIPCVSKC